MFPIRDNVRAHRAPIVTYALIAANLAAFAWQLHLPAPQTEPFLQLFGTVPRRLMDPVWARAQGFPPGAALTLLTSMFLHGGWFHLISNMWALWLFGDNVEDRLGRLRYAGFYLACGLLAMGAHVLLNARSPVPALGASGAIAGVMGAYLRFYPLARMVVMVPLFFYPLFFEVPAVVYLLVWFYTQVAGGLGTALLASGRGGGVAFWAHIGGFVAGLLFARARRRRAR